MEKSSLNTGTMVVPDCTIVVENDPSVKKIESCTRRIKESNKNTTVSREETIQFFLPNFAENSEMINCVQEISYVKNLTVVKPIVVQLNKCQPCDLVFDNLDCLTSHNLAFHSSKVFFCCNCNAQFGSKSEFKAHASFHEGIGEQDSAFGEMALSAAEDKAVSIIEADDVKKASKNSQNVQKNSYNNNEEFQESIFSSLESEAERSDVMEDAEIENLVIIRNAPSSVDVNGKSQQVEENAAIIENTEECFKNSIVHTIRVKIPLKGLNLKIPSEEHMISDFTEALQVPGGSSKQKQTFSCTYCTKTYSTKYRLANHENYHTHKYSYRCNACNKLYYSKESLTIHLYTHNDEMKPLSCEYDGCTKRFTTKTLLAAHARSHSDERDFVCDICLATFKQIKGLIRHIGTHHSENTYPCTVCSNSYSSSHLLADHMHSHSETRKYKCDVCGMAFAQANRRNQHKAVHAAERKHKCHLCSSAFKRASHLSAHVKRHARTHAYKCMACGLPFDSLREVSVHRKTHSATELNATRRRTPVRPALGTGFKCPVCDKLLLTKVTLQNHLALHTDVKPYQCDLCDQSFTTESNMTNHRVIHSGMKPFPCQYCPEGYMYKEERELHELTHRVVNPYVCEFCNEEFTSKMSLNQHLAVHADVRRHACDFCNQRFRRRDTLDAHIRTHTGERPYACSFCTQSFKQKGDCTMHERKAHKDQMQNNPVVASFADESVV